MPGVRRGLGVAPSTRSSGRATEERSSKRIVTHRRSVRPSTSSFAQRPIVWNPMRSKSSWSSSGVTPVKSRPSSVRCSSSTSGPISGMDTNARPFHRPVDSSDAMTCHHPAPGLPLLRPRPLGRRVVERRRDRAPRPLPRQPRPHAPHPTPSRRNVVRCDSQGAAGAPRCRRRDQRSARRRARDSQSSNPIVLR